MSTKIVIGDKSYDVSDVKFSWQDKHSGNLIVQEDTPQDYSFTVSVPKKPRVDVMPFDKSRAIFCHFKKAKKAKGNNMLRYHIKRIYLIILSFEKETDCYGRYAFDQTVFLLGYICPNMEKYFAARRYLERLDDKYRNGRQVIF
jgi:hypothetical protein